MMISQKFFKYFQYILNVIIFRQENYSCHIVYVSILNVCHSNLMNLNIKNAFRGILVGHTEHDYIVCHWSALLD